MREIAAKRLVMASLCELRPKLGQWSNKLYQLGAISTESIAAKERAMSLSKAVEQFAENRNLAFHFSDMVEPSDNLIRSYEETDKWSLEELNQMLEALIALGEQLKIDALNRC